MRRTRARLLCGRCILFRCQGREPFGRPQDERLVEHWHADGVEHRGEAADAVFHAGMIGGVEAGHEPVVAEEREQLRRLLGYAVGMEPSCTPISMSERKDSGSLVDQKRMFAVKNAGSLSSASWERTRSR